MTSERIRRESLRRFATESLGRNPDNPRGIRRQVLLDGAEREILALPYNASQFSGLQNNEGVFVYMVDLDGLDQAPLG